MLGLLAHPVFARMYAAQVVALAGTGLLTVALGLLAYDLAGQQAGVVLGTAYAIKMIAYVGLAPLAAALVARLPRRAVLIAADLVRAGAALALPFVQTEWQIYGLIFLLQAASATFTPTFQAAIPDILPDEAQYTRALSLSRLAYDLENLASPALAAALLSVVSYSNLFAGTVAGFLVSACLVASTSLPHNKPQVAAASFRSRLTRGTFIYLSTPRLRGLLALTFTAAAASGFVLVNTVVIVRQGFGFDDRAVALAMAAYGVGSMLAALALPQVLQRLPDRPVMLAASFGLVLLMLGTGLWMAVGSNGPGWSAMLGLWAALGLAYSAILTPAGRLLPMRKRE